MEGDRIQVFVSYAHENRRHLQEFRKHTADLRRNQMIVFDDQEIQPGQRWESMIGDKLDTADIVVLLVTAEFVASEFCYLMEFGHALERERAGRCRIIPVNLGPVDLDSRDPLRTLQNVPQGRSIFEMRSGRASAWKQVAHALRKCVEGLRNSGSPNRSGENTDQLPQNVIPISRARNAAIHSSNLRDSRASRSPSPPLSDHPAAARSPDEGWQSLIDLLRATHFHDSDWQSLAMSTGRLREALELAGTMHDFLPPRAQEVVTALRRNLTVVLSPSATQTNILAACATCERLRAWLLDILTTPVT